MAKKEAIENDAVAKVEEEKNEVVESVETVEIKEEKADDGKVEEPKVEEKVVEEVKEETKVEQPIAQPTKKKSSVPLIIIIVILAVSVLGLGAFIVYDKFINDEGNSSENDNDKKKSSDKKDDDKTKDGDKKDDDKKDDDKKDDKKYELTVYKNTYGYCMKSQYCNTPGFTITTSSDNSQIFDVVNIDKKTYVLYSDGDIYLYDINKEKSTKLKNLDNSYLSYNFVYSYSDNKIYGVECGKGTKIEVFSNAYSNSALYNIDNDEMMYENKGYHGFSVSNDGNYVNATKLTGSGDDEKDFTGYLLALNREDVVLSDVGMCVNFSTKKYDGNTIYIESTGCTESGAITLYNSKKEKIFKVADGKNYSFDGNGFIYANVNDEINKYDSTGKLIKSNVLSKNIKQVVLNYAVKINSKDELVIVNLDSLKEYKLMDWKSKYYYHSMISGYYDANSLANENEKEAGIYLIIGYGDNTSEEMESGVEFYFNPKTNEIKKYDLDAIGGYAKPVLYLYPEEETKVTVNFENEDSLTTTYPKFNGEWKVTAKPNGDLYDENGRYYYGLYWEEDRNHEVSFDAGFYVTKDNAIKFLEEKLSYIGLTEREMDEFIMYWLPILEKNGQSLVYFELTEERDSYNKLEISPAPDSVLRIAIHVKKVNGYRDIKEEKLTHFERTGFTAVEWGGINY